MRPLSFGFALSVATALFASTAMADCNGAAEPCRIENGTYHIVLPEGETGPLPAIVLLHGYGGEGVGTIRNKAMVSLMLGRGYAVIAADGQPRDNGEGRTWDFHPDRPATRDETAFLVAVADDAAARFGLQRDAMLLAGFSIGGSMTSYVACEAPNAFAAYAPVAGSFWRPHPVDCAGPVRLLHTHGKADQTVPLTGREIMPGFVQGNVFEAMEIWRKTNGCPSTVADRTETLGIYTVQHWTKCQPGTDLRLALHEGGHSIPKGWAQMAVDWFETR
ncbi:MAG: polyhydroxybutyrate depolymerase [Rhodobacterales bacterium]|nr:MAG: polyhydroxybutyrate depolymerase [Rhodobacterales bacterium]